MAVGWRGGRNVDAVVNPITGKPASLQDAPETEAQLPKPPPSWTHSQTLGLPLWMMKSIGNPHRDLAVTRTVGVELDGRMWVHVAVSHPKRMPTWDDLSLVKRLFIGDERPAVQVHPVASEHYSLRGEGRAERVLHLWAPLTGGLPLPDFLAARGGTL